MPNSFGGLHWLFTKWRGCFQWYFVCLLIEILWNICCQWSGALALGKTKLCFRMFQACKWRHNHVIRVWKFGKAGIWMERGVSASKCVISMHPFTPVLNFRCTMHRQRAILYRRLEISWILTRKLYFMNFNVVGRDHQHHWHHISFIKHHLTNSLHCCPSGVLIFLCKAENFSPSIVSLVVELRSLRNCFHLLISKLFKFSPHHLPCQHQFREINLICRSSCPHPHSTRLFNKSNLH